MRIAYARRSMHGTEASLTFAEWAAFQVLCTAIVLAALTWLALFAVSTLCPVP